LDNICIFVGEMIERRGWEKKREGVVGF